MKKIRKKKILTQEKLLSLCCHENERHEQLTRVYKHNWVLGLPLYLEEI